MIDIETLLLEICGDPRVLEPDTDLVESGLMDSYAMIELFSALEEQGIVLQPTRIDRKLLRTLDGIKQLAAEAQDAAEQIKTPLNK